MTLHCRLREIMRERQLTVADLSRMSGVRRHPIGSVPQPGGKRISREALAALCEALDLSLAELFIVVPQGPDRHQGCR